MRRWKLVYVTVVCGGMLRFCGEALGHGFVTFASTPVSPPQGFVWLKPVALALFAAVNFWLFWGPRWRDRLLAALGVPLTIALVGWGFYAVGYVAMYLRPRNPLGLGPPQPVFWGLGWTEPRAVLLFLGWNVCGIVSLGGCVLLLAHVRGFRREEKKWTRVANANAALYVLCLTPYILTGALVHGLAAGHEHTVCVSRQGRIAEALFRYARDHAGRSPTAQSMEEMVEEIGLSHRPKWGYEDLGTSYICPLGAARERQPKPYLWTSEMAGATLEDLVNMASGPSVPLACPYHTDKWERLLWQEEVVAWLTWGSDMMPEQTGPKAPRTPAPATSDTRPE